MSIAPKLALVSAQRGAALPNLKQQRERVATIPEIAAALGETEDAIRLKAYRRTGFWTFQFDLPSEMHEGKTQIVVGLRHLPLPLRKAIKKRRRATSAEPGAGHKRGAVLNRDEDPRVAFSEAETLAIEGLYLKRTQPSVSHVFEQLTGSCIRCHSGAMRPLDRSAKARYKLHRCSNEGCGFAFSYASVRRAIRAIKPELVTAGREGENAYVNKHGRYAVRSVKLRPNDCVYGDHHECDILVWDPRQPLLRGGEPRLLRPWLSAWEDYSTRVTAWRLCFRANADALSLAFRAYVLRFGLPKQAWTDNGADYLSNQFLDLCKELNVEVHQTLPSKRTGESHAKSKLIERWFGTFERGIGREQPGWTGSNAVERDQRKDVLWTLQKQHSDFLRGERKTTPLLTFEQYQEKVEAWIESYLRTPHSSLNAAPLEAFAACERPVHKVGERALDALLMRAKTRIIGRNGVEVDGRVYWDSAFYGLRHAPCTVRWDRADLGKVVVSVHEKGKPDRIVIAHDSAYANWSEGDFEELRKIKKEEREVWRAALDIRQREAAGITPREMVLAEKAKAAEMPLAAVAGGVPVLTSGDRLAHGIANAIENRASNRAILEQFRASNDAPPALVELLPERKPVPSLYNDGPVTWERLEPEPKNENPPFFMYEWERAEWELEHGPLPEPKTEETEE